MAIAIDGSSPAAVTHNDAIPTTSSFTAPANSYMLATFGYDSTGGTPFINDTGGATWTPIAGTSVARVRAWGTFASSAVSRTVHAEDGNGGGGQPANLKVYVLTGVNPTTPVGNTGSGSADITNNTTVNGYTSSQDQSWGFAVAHTSTSNSGVPTSTDVEEAWESIFGPSGLHARKSAATTPSSSTVQFNFDAAGTGATSWNWLAIEILPDADTVPGAPTLVMATGGDTRIYLDWDAPASDGGDPITDYLVETSANGTTGWSTVTEGTSTATETLLTGQTNGTTQYFRISAINSIGTGSPSNVLSATPRVGSDTILQEDGDFHPQEDGDYSPLEEA